MKMSSPIGLEPNPNKSENKIESVMPKSPPDALRFLVCHKHPISARLRFVRFPDGGICAPRPLPKLSVLADSGGISVAAHPAAALHTLCRTLQIADEKLMLLAECRTLVEIPGGLLPIYLTALVGDDPPPLPPGHTLIGLPDCFALPPVERELLRAAYDYLM